MSKLSLKNIFYNNPVIQKGYTNSLIIEDTFPFNISQLNEKKNLYLFISLSCYDCIELLPELSSFNDKFDGNIVVFSTGDKSENEAICLHFGFDFPFYTITEKEYAEVYKVEQTPFAYYTDSKNIIRSSSIVQNGKDLRNLVS